MSTGSKFGVLRSVFLVSLFGGGFMMLTLMYYKSNPLPKCYPGPGRKNFMVDDTKKDDDAKNLILMWFWPEEYKFEVRDCKHFFNINSCRLSDNRSLYHTADEVLIFHKAIKDDLSNIPTSPRPGFQRWIWLNLDPPSNTRIISGTEHLFNLSLNFRQDADIPVQWRLTARKVSNGTFLPPRKENLVCWIMDEGTNGTGYNYYSKLAKHIDVTVLNPGGGLSSYIFEPKDQFSTISSCKFFLAFENSIYKDYITEKLNGPLAAGTVPVVLGPSRQNYEDFIPGESFIHVNDFPDEKSLAKFLMRLDKDDKAYLRYFEWRQHYYAQRHPTEKRLKYLKAVCLACDHVSRNKEYRVIPNLNKWYK